MEFFKAIFTSILLGTVQGLTEFLPVSSSGHLVLIERLLGVSFVGGALFFHLMLHLGSLVAVLIAMRKEIRAACKRPVALLMLFTATLPAGAAAFFAEKIDGLFMGDRGLAVLCVFFGITAVLLLAAELVATRRKRAKPFGWGQAAAMGFMQAVAVLPGISRSGSTIAAGVFAGASAEDASKFSFLMSIPVILGGAVLGIAEIAASPTVRMGPAEGVGLACGMLAAAVSGYFALRLMRKAMGRANYKWFALYLILLSLAGLWLDLLA